MPAQDLAQARVLAESDRLVNPAEYQREILRVALAVFDLLSGQAKAEPATVPPPTRKR